MTITDFLKYVLPDVPGCPTPLAKQAVLDAATEFLTETQAWNEIQDAQLVTDSVQEYSLDAPSGARCIDVREVYTSSGRLIGKTIDQLAEIMPNWQTAEGNTPAYYTRSFDFENLSVYPKPIDPPAETLTVHGVYTLKDTATSIPDVIVQRYRRPIASGAKYFLMVTPSTTWHNLQLAQYHKGVFDDAKSVARITAEHGKTRGAASVRPRRFGQ